LGQENGDRKIGRRKLPSWLPQAAGYTLSIACLAWVLHGYDLREIEAAVRDLDWPWVCLCVIFDLVVYVCHGWRWTIVLSPVQRMPLWRTVQSIYIGLFANEILPLRTGELIRCYLLAHWNGVYISIVLASVAIERLMDGIWMVLAFLITANFLKLPAGIVDVVRLISALLALGLAALLFIIFHKHHAHAVVKASRWAATLQHVVDGLHLMGNWRTLGKGMLASLFYLVLQVLSLWALMKAYRLDLSFWAAAAVIVVVRFGTVIPNAPGNLGLFQAVCTLALMLFDVEKDVAKTFSFLMFIALTLPLLMGGAVAVALTGLNLADIRARAKRGLEAARHHPAPDNRGS
jgi:uncharacterized protein (TIRG00374 family)